MSKMNEHSKDYHDYVFRNGTLVGDFEGMYRNSDMVPWHQDEQDDWIDVRLTVELLKGGAFDEIHDLSCGLGHYLALIQKRLGTANCRAFGYDIAETALAKAKKTFPEFTFQRLDLRIAPEVARHSRLAARRLFVIRATLWYVFPKLADVIKTIRSLMSAGDRLLVVQNFPALDGPFIGKEVIPNPTALIEHFRRSFSPVWHVWYEDAVKVGNDNWMIALFSLRDTE
jgi:SAM-dependent methyltransferase